MIESGMVIASRYEIIEKIGTGGMSDVFKALDKSLARIVAIKVLKDEFVTDMGFVSKFRAEAMAAAGLEHPNIVNIYDVGNEDGRHFIVMEYVEGITLKTYIAKKGRLSHNELLSIAIQVGRGIEAAHNKNIIHRDIKPQNIIISKEGKVKVTDFGIARAVTSNTINADRMGSVHYSSPEQARNGYVTYQSDIYSLGIVMYEMCTGRVPFDGDTTVSVAIQHLQSELTPPSMLVPDVPISVEKIIIRSTMKSPERRYENIGDMLTDLKKALVNPDEDFVVIPSNLSNATAPIEPAPQVSMPTVAPVTVPEAVVEPAKPAKTKAKSRPVVDPEDEDDDDEVSSKMDKAVTIMGIAAAIVIILIVIYLLGSFLGWIPFGRNSGDVTTTSSQSAAVNTTGEEAMVPNVLGYTEREAKDAIEEAGFTYKKIGEASSEKYEEGQVMEQSPEGNKQAVKGTTVEVLVSSGEGNIPIPGVVGQTQEQAIRAIEASDFICSTQTEYSDTVEQGKVIRQSPTGSEMGNKGDLITIWVSRGNELASVPNVVGSTQTEATNSLNNAGFKVQVTTEASESVEKDKVIRQSPSGQAESGSTITIVVSEGSKSEHYYFSKMVSPIGGEPTYVVLRDENGNELTHWLVTTTSTLNASNIPVSSGVLCYYTEDRSMELAPRESVSFNLQ